MPSRSAARRCASPSADLAIAIAIASAQRATSVPADLVAIGEVGLAGELRRVPRPRARLAEAARLGFTQRRRPEPARQRPSTASPASSGRSSPCGDHRRRCRWPASMSTGRRADGRPTRVRLSSTVVQSAHGGQRQSVARQQPDSGRAAARDPGRRRARAPSCAKGSSASCAAAPAHSSCSATTGSRVDLHRRFRPRRRRSPRPACASSPRWTARSSATGTRPASCTAGVHLMPDPSILTARDRHPSPHRRPGRPPDRRSRSSRSRSRCTSSRCTSTTCATCSRTTGAILGRANQALATLERYKLPPRRGVRHACRRWRSRTSSPSATSRRSPSGSRWCSRSPSEIEDYVLELGTDGRLLALQLEELVGGVDAERELVIRDYLPTGRRARTPKPSWPSSTRSRRPTCSTSARSPGRLRSARPRPSTAAVSPRGYRLLARSRASPTPSSSGSSSTSARCRSCWPPASTTCRPSRASATLRARGVREVSVRCDAERIPREAQSAPRLSESVAADRSLSCH